MAKEFDVVITESSVGLEIISHNGSRSACVLPFDAHRCGTVAELVAKLDEMSAVYGWDVGAVRHRKETADGSVWARLR
ncbi:MAG TPA: hypothetical protein VGI39_04925 [Polyangiaceae bacterium]